MKKLSLSLSNDRRRQWLATSLGAIALWALSTACSPAAAQAKSWWDAVGKYDTSGAAVTRLPAPTIGPGELPRPCPASVQQRGYSTEEFQFASPEARASMQPFARATLFGWAQKHFRYPNTACVEREYVVRKFQAAIGTDITGALSIADIRRLDQALDAGRQILSQERSGAALPRTVVDFLPRAGQSCTQKVDALRREVATKVQARAQALPNHLYRESVLENIRREITAEYLVVAPAWTEYWNREPLLGEWSKRNDCTSELRFMVEHWQQAIGALVNARDPQAIARTQELVAKAKADHAAFASQQQQGFAAAAAARGETAKARVWTLDELADGARLSEVLERMPSALCTAAANEVSCSHKPPCQAENDALRAAQGADAQSRPWVKPESLQTPNSGPGRDHDLLQLRLAQTALERCKAEYPHTAAANSRITFAGQAVSSARLVFDGQGLATLNFSMGNPEPGRTLLTRRFGKVETQQEVRTRDEAVVIPGGTGYVPGVGSVNIAPALERIPVSYSVTRHIWSSPKARVEEATGNFTFRFFN
jgi:hypothetical protein